MVAMASWAMLFGTFILSFLLARVKTPIWPPINIAAFPVAIPIISTFVILGSSIFVHRGYVAQKRQNLADFRFYWGFGLVLGLFFTGLQVYSLVQWFALGVDFKSHVYASSISFLVAFHALHLSVGLGGLGWKLVQPGRVETSKLWTWFWHFLDIVWVAIFMAIAL